MSATISKKDSKNKDNNNKNNMKTKIAAKGKDVMKQLEEKRKEVVIGKMRGYSDFSSESNKSYSDHFLDELNHALNIQATDLEMLIKSSDLLCSLTKVQDDGTLRRRLLLGYPEQKWSDAFSIRDGFCQMQLIFLAAGFENKPIPECQVEERVFTEVIAKMNELGNLIAYLYRTDKQKYERARDMRVERLMQEEKAKTKTSRNNLNSTAGMTEDESQWWSQDQSMRRNENWNSREMSGEEQMRSLNSRANPGEEQICSSRKYKEQLNSPWTPLGANMSRIPEGNENSFDNSRPSDVRVNMASVNSPHFDPNNNFPSRRSNESTSPASYTTPVYNQGYNSNPTSQTQAMVTVAVQQPEKWGNKRDHRSIKQFLREYENFSRMMQWNRTDMIQRIENYLIESAFEWIQQVNPTCKRNWKTFKTKMTNDFTPGLNKRVKNSSLRDYHQCKQRPHETETEYAWRYNNLARKAGVNLERAGIDHLDGYEEGLILEEAQRDSRKNLYARNIDDAIATLAPNEAGYNMLRSRLNTGRRGAVDFDDGRFGRQFPKRTSPENTSQFNQNYYDDDGQRFNEMDAEENEVTNNYPRTSYDERNKRNVRFNEQSNLNYDDRVHGSGERFSYDRENNYGNAWRGTNMNRNDSTFRDNLNVPIQVDTYEDERKLLEKIRRERIQEEVDTYEEERKLLEKIRREKIREEEEEILMKVKTINMAKAQERQGNVLPKIQLTQEEELEREAFEYHQQLENQRQVNVISSQNRHQDSSRKAEMKNPNDPHTWKKFCEQCNKEGHEKASCWLNLMCAICRGKHPTEKCFKKCKWCGKVHDRGEMCEIEKYMMMNSYKQMPDAIKNMLTQEMKESMQLNWMGDQLTKRD